MEGVGRGLTVVPFGVVVKVEGLPGNKVGDVLVLGLLLGVSFGRHRESLGVLAACGMFGREQEVL